MIRAIIVSASEEKEKHAASIHSVCVPSLTSLHSDSFVGSIISTSCIAMTLKAMTLPFGFKLEHALWLCDRP